MTWLYLYILRERLVEYESQGWEYVGDMFPLGGFDSVIVRRPV